MKEVHVFARLYYYSYSRGPTPFLAPYPGHCISVKRTHCCEKSPSYFAKHKHFAEEFHCGHALSSVMIIVKSKLSPKVYSA